MKTISALAASFAALSLASAANAAIVDLTITGSWLASDFDVSATSTDPAAGIPEEDDDAVFGVSPSDGSTSFTLRVDTSSVQSFATGDFGVTHDWFGYDLVELLGGHTFGSASWDTADITTGLVGPNGATAALWTDTDITSGDPTRLSFRMFGDWEGPNADIFVGSRTATTIGDQFLMWEYFAGEEIRSNTYSAQASAVPIPAPILLLLGGLAGLAGVARRKSA